jgi:membrane protease YdiL (CAAX protease family)
MLLALLSAGLAGLFTLFSKKGRAWLVPPPRRAPRARWGGVEAVQGAMVAVAFMMFTGTLSGRFFPESTVGESAVGIATQLLLVAVIVAITAPFARGGSEEGPRLFRRAPLSALGLSFDDSRKNALRGLAGGAMALTVAVAVSYLVGLLCRALEMHVPTHPMIERAGTTAGPLEIAVILFSAVVVAPLAEEVVFRGFIFPSVRDRWGLVAGILVSSLLFGLMHAGLPAVAATFVLGAAFCALYERSGTLVAPVTAHALFNLTMLSLRLLQRFGAASRGQLH